MLRFSWIVRQCFTNVLANFDLHSLLFRFYCLDFVSISLKNPKFEFQFGFPFFKQHVSVYSLFRDFLRFLL